MTPPPEAGDADALFARFRDHGDAAALGALFDLLSPVLFRMALALAPDPASAEDALQETFLAAMGSADRHDPSRPVTPWLVGILQLKVHEARRRARRAPDPARLPPPIFPEEPSAAAEGAEEVERVRRAMDALPEPLRAVAVLRWRYGMEPAAIADARNENPATVRSHLHRAKERLRETLSVLPAILLLPGEAAPRGLDAVRAAVMGGAAAAAAAGATAGAGPAGAAAAAAAATTGGILMANKAMALGAAALLLGVAGWFAFRGEGGGAGAPPARPPIVSHSDTIPAAPSPAPRPSPSPAEPPSWPPPVDLERCDRDLDLFGVVVDGEGAPVPGARVEALYRVWPEGALVPRSMWGAVAPGPATLSSSDGSFALRLSRGDLVDLRAAKEGVGAGRLAARLAGERVRLVLGKGAALLLRVKDGEGRPVAGARVLALRLDRRRVEPLGGGETGADGTWTLEGLPPGLLHLDVEHPVLAWGRLRSPREIPASGTVEMEVVLAAGRTLSGLVLDDRTGEPVAGAVIGETWVMHRPVRSGPDGRYEKPGVSTEYGLQLYAEAEGYARASVFEDEEGRADFRLRPGDAVAGRVLDPSGAPAAGARVMVAGTHVEAPGLQGSDTGEALADGEGRFRIGGLRHDVPHSLLIEHAGAGRLLREIPAPAGEGGLLDLGDLRLEEGRAVEGRVVDEGMAPLPDRGVVLAGPAGKWSGDRHVTRVTRRSDDLGRFRFQGVAPGTYEASLANEEGNVPAAATVEVGAEEDVLDVVLGMAAGGEVRVLVADPEGNPVEGIALNLTVGGFARSARSGADGRAAFTGVPRGEARVRAWDTSSPHRWVMEESPGTPAAAGGPEVRITLHPASPIRGRVVDPEGKGLGGVMVHFREPGAPYGQIATSGPDGSFEFSSGAGRPVVIELHPFRTVKGSPQPERSDWRAEPVTASAPADGVILRAALLAQDRTLTVRVLDLEDRPLQGFLLTLLREGQDSFPATDGNGEVRLEGLAAEEIQFGVFAPQAAAGQASPLPEGAVLPAPVKVMPEGQVVTLRLRQGTPLPGTVLDSTGAPAAGALVYVQAEDHSVAQAVADGDGRFRVFVPPGVKLLMAHAVLAGEAGPREMVQVRGADLEGAELTLRLEAVKGR